MALPASAADERRHPYRQHLRLHSSYGGQRIDAEIPLDLLARRSHDIVVDNARQPQWCLLGLVVVSIVAVVVHRQDTGKSRLVSVAIDVDDGANCGAGMIQLALLRLARRRVGQAAEYGGRGGRHISHLNSGVTADMST